MARKIRMARKNPEIKSIGIELECGINRKNYSQLFRDVLLRENHLAVERDASVMVSGYHKSGYISNCEIKIWNTDIDCLLLAVKKLFVRYKIRQNSTCGNHIHVRFNSIKWKNLINDNNLSAFIEEYKIRFNKEKYLNRLRNNFCLADNLERHIRNQYFNDCGSRYIAINLKNILYQETDNLQTIEFRIFPYAENWKEIKENIIFLLIWINKHINKGLKINQKINIINKKGILK